MRTLKANPAGKTLALLFLGTALLAPLPVSATQSEPDRLLGLSSGFRNANYYFCFAQSREAAYGVQVFTEVVSTDARVTLYQMLSGVDAATNPLPGRPWSSVSCMDDRGGGMATFKTRENAVSARQEFMASSRKIGLTIVEIPWPGKLGDRDMARSSSGKTRQAAGKPASASDKPGLSSKSAIPTSTPKYIEVAGPDGPIRLSPEVAARNQAAAEEYRRKMEEHAQAQTEHERKLALHQQSIAAAAAEKLAYNQKLALNDAQVAAHGAALEQYKSARPPSAGARGWMYCEARGAPGDKRRYYSQVTEVAYVPGEIPIVDVMGKNRPAFKSYVAGTHSVFFATDSLVHCPYSTTSLAEAEALMARDKRGDGNNEIQIIQTGWMPAS